jgi:hypothetical protein
MAEKDNFEFCGLKLGGCIDIFAGYPAFYYLLLFHRFPRFRKLRRVWSMNISFHCARMRTVKYLEAWLIITGFRMWWLDLFATSYNYNLGLLAITAATADFHTLQFSVSTSRILATDLNTGTVTSNQYKVFLSFLLSHPGLAGQSQSYFTARGFFLSQLNPCGNCPYVTSSLTRRWVPLLRICLAFFQVYILYIQHVIENFFLLH